MGRSTRIKYRCNRCRGRNVFRKPLDEYVRPKKCQHCGHTRFYLDKERNRVRPRCACDGYHFIHRPGSAYCKQNPLYPFYEARDRWRIEGLELLKIGLDCVLGPKPVEERTAAELEECPF